jgi:hypothetical protein
MDMCATEEFNQSINQSKQIKLKRLFVHANRAFLRMNEIIELWH